MKVWIVGKINPENNLEWEFNGVFDSEEKAVSACKDKRYFVGPATINIDIDDIVPGDKSIDWPNSYYPKEKN